MDDTNDSNGEKPSSPTRRTKRSKRPFVVSTIFIVLVVVGLWVAGILAPDLMGQPVELNDDVERVLQSIARGEAHELYQAASPEFRKTILEETFVDLTATMNETLGPFERVVDVTHAELNDSEQGKIGIVRLRLKFKNAATTGSLSFHRVGKNWALLGLSINIPDKMVAAVNAKRNDPARTEAPQPAVEVVKGIVEGLKNGEIAEVYQSTSAIFRETVTAEAFSRLVNSRVRASGAIKGMGPINASSQNRSQDRASITTTIVFERGTTEAGFGLIKVEGTWRLATLRMRPRRPTAPMTF